MGGKVRSIMWGPSTKHVHAGEMSPDLYLVVLVSHKHGLPVLV